MKFIQGVPVRQLSQRFSIGFALVVVCIACIGAVTIQNLEHIRADWNQYTDNAQRKSALINDLNSAVGYGGAIHQFKNFVLRKDTPRLQKVSEGFARAQQLIGEYRQLTLTSTEAAALDSISDVFAAYQQAIPLISSMASENASSVEIDKAVRIDDSGALAGIEALNRQVQTLLEEEGGVMERDLSFLESLTLYGLLVNTMLLVTLLTLLLLTFRAIIGQIGGEPNRIMLIAKRIAEGDLDEELEGRDSCTGIYGSIVSMQENLRVRTTREKSVAAINERLKQSLDNASSNVMVADVNNDIVFINKASAALFTEKEQQIKAQLPHFDAGNIVGSNIDVFHADPAVQHAKVKQMAARHDAVVRVGGCTFKLSVSPVITEEGERLGTVVEWFDKTQELKNEAEVRALVEAAARGDLSKRIDTEGSVGFYRGLSESMNDLMDVNDRAVHEVQQVFAAMAKGDLTARVEGEYQGVYQQLKEDANSTVAQLTDIITRVKNSAMVIATASTELISTNKNLNATAEDGARQAGIASTAANNVMANMDAVTQAASDMQSSVKEITRNVSEAADVASKAVTLAQSTNMQVRKLTTSSSDIGNVIKVINSIAEQTNLLALNATIEAARAGDAGKGFAVVANEVKELAKGTANATDEIAQKVKAIQGDSDTAVQAIGNISEIIETISNYQNTISCAVQEQSQATQRISENADDAARGNVEITRTSERVSEGTESTVSGVSQVQASAEALSRMAVELADLVEGFQVDEHRKWVGNSG